MQHGCYSLNSNFRITIYLSELPTSFRYRLSKDYSLHFVIIFLFTSTQANHISSNNTWRYEWFRLEQNDGHFIQYAIYWDTTRTQTPLSLLQRCKYYHWKYVPGCTVQNGLWNRKQQEWEAPRNWMWVYLYRGRWPSTYNMVYSWCL